MVGRRLVVRRDRAVYVSLLGLVLVRVVTRWWAVHGPPGARPLDVAVVVFFWRARTAHSTWSGEHRRRLRWRRGFGLHVYVAHGVGDVLPAQSVFDAHSISRSQRRCFAEIAETADRVGRHHFCLVLLALPAAVPEAQADEGENDDDDCSDRGPQRHAKDLSVDVAPGTDVLATTTAFALSIRNAAVASVVAVIRCAGGASPTALPLGVRVLVRVARLAGATERAEHVLADSVSGAVVEADVIALVHVIY